MKKSFLNYIFFTPWKYLFVTLLYWIGMILIFKDDFKFISNNCMWFIIGYLFVLMIWSQKGHGSSDDLYE